MLCKDAFLRILQRQQEGVMYHGEMVDYYSFLHLDQLKELHIKQVKDEFCLLEKMKCDYIKVFEMFPFYTITGLNIIPTEWKNKTTKNIDESSLKILIKTSLEKYLEWEKETLEIYQNMAQVLKDNMHMYLYKKMCCVISGVQEEINTINELMIDAASYDYCPSYFK